MEQEEAGELQGLDHAQLLVESGARLVQRAGRVAPMQPHVAQLGEAPARRLILNSRIAVAEVARQIEPELLGQRGGLLDRLEMVGEARCHRLR